MKERPGGTEDVRDESDGPKNSFSYPCSQPESSKVSGIGVSGCPLGVSVAEALKRGNTAVVACPPQSICVVPRDSSTDGSTVPPVRFVLYACDATTLSTTMEAIRKIVDESGCRISTEEDKNEDKDIFGSRTMVSKRESQTTLSSAQRRGQSSPRKKNESEVAENDDVSIASDITGISDEVGSAEDQEDHIEASHEAGAAGFVVDETVAVTNDEHNSTYDENSDGGGSSTGVTASFTFSKVSKSRVSSSSESSATTKQSASSKSCSTLLSGRDSSVSSILSSATSSDDTSCHSSKSLSELSARMRRKFHYRDKILKRIARGKGRSYVAFLEENEKAARMEAKKVLERKRRERKTKMNIGSAPKKVGGTASFDENGVVLKTPDGTESQMGKIWERHISIARSVFSLPSMLLVLGMNKILPSNHMTGLQGSTNERQSVSTSKGFANALRGIILFDFYHVMPGFATMILYSLAHLSVYEVLNLVVLELSKDTVSQNKVYLYALATSLFLARISGGVWSWVNDDLHTSIKFDMHNRLRLRDFNAQILLWFRNHPRLKCLIDVTSLYLCFISVSYFLQYLVMPSLLDIRENIIESLPSIEYNISTHVKDALLGDTPARTYPSHPVEMNDTSRYCFNEEDELDDSGEECYNTLELIDMLKEEDEWHLFTQVSIMSYYDLLGDEGSAVVSPLSAIAFYTASSAISILWLFKIGFDFWDM